MNWKALQDEMRRTNIPCAAYGITGIVYSAFYCLATVTREEFSRMHGRHSDPGGAVGLAAVELLEFCNTSELDAEVGRGVWPDGKNYDKNRDQLLLAVQALGNLSGDVAWGRQPSEMAVGQILYYLDAWCVQRDLKLIELAVEAQNVLQAAKEVTRLSAWQR